MGGGDRDRALLLQLGRYQPGHLGSPKRGVRHDTGERGKQGLHMPADRDNCTENRFRQEAECILWGVRSTLHIPCTYRSLKKGC